MVTVAIDVDELNIQQKDPVWGQSGQLFNWQQRSSALSLSAYYP